MSRSKKPVGPVAPDFVEPCLAETASQPPAGAHWLHEIKYDGYRMQAHLAGGSARLLTRNGLDWTDKIGRVVGELAGLPAKSALIDGEAIVETAAGVSDFHALQRQLKHGRDARISLVAFDLLHLDGQDLRPMPLIERKQTLRTLIGTAPKLQLLRYGDHIPGDGAPIFQNACGMGLEGIISKRADRPYRSGRSTDWLKSKCVMADAFVVAGFVPGKTSAALVGSLILGWYDHAGQLSYAGKVGTGFTPREAAAMFEALNLIRIPASPFAARLAKDQREGAVWIEPRLVAQVEYRSWTTDGLVRHAAFKAFREDKRPDQIGRPSSLRDAADAEV